MRLGMLLRYKGESGGPDMERIQEAERLGFESVWTGESWGCDTVTPLTWVLAQTTKLKAGAGIMQMSARTPACAAMTMMTLNAMSGGRFLMGVGPSGPQVIEGWHGEPFGKPLMRTREYIAILRQILERKEPLRYEGEHYQIPYAGEGATGLGKPLKSILHGDPSNPIYTASFSPAGLRTAGEVADGTLPIYMSPEQTDLITGPLMEGMAKAQGNKTLADFDVAPYVRVALGDDLQACRDAIRPELALYIGGMGAREKNFYNDYAKRLGYADAAVKIQDEFLSGRRAEAAAAVPDALIDELCLVGSADRIKDRLQAWKEASKSNAVGTMLLGNASVDAMRVIAEAAA
ncbi:MAG: LLM class F420-dependent oxidoreductase [Rhodospirillaceae bacterium]|nr:LLM class F420-dependent oxidoreductase [Rhodospirillaceae bacterium]MDD9913308.1 LLM class F420-dependent oxidoreductase [Rhodospirillaceae bacterium]MDD9926109.1 LLM class F420-dependent oxidoreductase [Rhodospirillaceae bacterium]